MVGVKSLRLCLVLLTTKLILIVFVEKILEATVASVVAG